VGILKRRTAVILQATQIAGKYRIKLHAAAERKMLRPDPNTPAVKTWTIDTSSLAPGTYRLGANA
jgi:hypothetical protein